MKTTQREVLDFADLRERARYLSREKLLELIDIFINCSEPVVESCVTAFTGRQFDKIQELLHKLKGSASQVGAVRLYEYCDEITNAIDDPQHFTAAQYAQGLPREFETTRSALLEYAKDSLGE